MEKRQRLERAFMLASSVQRDAERVTAEEIRAMIGELEQGLGGVYSVLAEELQRPLIVTVLNKMSMRKKLPTLPKGVVSPRIITGIEGLGRASDFNKLILLIRTLQENLGQPAVLQWLNIAAFMKRTATAIGVDITGLLKTQEQVQMEQQQSLVADMTGKLGPNMINAISKQPQEPPMAQTGVAE